VNLRVGHGFVLRTGLQVTRVEFTAKVRCELGADAKR
jgi:hypothetical protein